MDKHTAATIADRIAQRQKDLAEHARGLTDELAPSALAARARDDIKVAITESKRDAIETLDATRRTFMAKARATITAIKADPRGTITGENLTEATFSRQEILGLAACVGGLVLIGIIRATRR